MRRRRRGTPREKASTLALLVGLVLVAVVLVSVFTGNMRGSKAGCLVTDKDRVASSNGGSDMRVYTENCGVMRVKDNLFTGTFNAADLYAGIEPGETYDFKVTGFRLPVLSQFPSIYDYEVSSR